MGKGVHITVDLNEFDFDEIKEFAEENLDMIHLNDIKLDKFYDNWEIIEFLEEKGYEINTNFIYPNNSIVTKNIYDRLLKNVDKIPLQELEHLLDKYNCI